MIPSCKNEINISNKESLIFFWNEDTKNLAFFQNIVNIHDKGKDILIIAGGSKHAPIIIPFYANETLRSDKYILVSSIDDTRIIKFSNEGYNQIQLVQSRLDITITDGLVSEIHYTVTARKSFDYLDATSPNSSTDYIPTLNNHPATKKYVDNQIQNNLYHNYTTGETLSGDIWIDGSPVYRKVIQINSVIKNLSTFAHNISGITNIVNIKGYGKITDNAFVPINSCLTNGVKQYNSCVCLEGNNIIFYMSADREKFISANVIIEYTKAL